MRYLKMQLSSKVQSTNESPYLAKVSISDSSGSVTMVTNMTEKSSTVGLS